MAAARSALPYLVFFLASTSWSLPTDFIFNGFYGSVDNLTFDGVAHVTPEGVLRLTNCSDQVVGHAFYSFPVNMLDTRNPAKPAALSFSTAFVFEIMDEDTKGAHGLAFVIAPSKALHGVKSNQFLGLLGEENNGNFSNHLFAVEFDTFQNTDDGYTDTPENHVGVDINSLASVFSAPAAYYENGSKNISLEGGEPIQAWIDYNGDTKVLNVTISPLNIPSKPRTPLISRAVDVSAVLKEYMYVGFSSSTGLYLASSHNIMGWSFSTNGMARALDVSVLPRPSQVAPAKSRLGPVGAGAIVAAVTLVLAILAAAISWYLWRRAKVSETIEEWELDYPHRFSYRDLYRATKGFKHTEIIGSGGFGQVYKGVLPCTREEVAIKKISNNSNQGLQEFVAEVASLGRMRQRHLVQLQGWCKRNADLLLVYEFMPNGSLDALLFNKEKGKELSWNSRFKILKGIASGLLYLHEEWEQVVVHRDIKASNVLLDADMNGKLGDFGLAKLYEHGQNPRTTRVVGTLGYIAPELSYAGKATASSDVYAYGVLLLEVACGRRPIEPYAATSELVLMDWVKACQMKGQLLQVADPRLQGCYPREEMELVLTLGLHCCLSAPGLRPTIRQVTQYLNGDDKLRGDTSPAFSEADSFDLASLISYSTTSCGDMSASGSFPR